MEELPSGPSGGSNNGAELVHDHCGPCPAHSPQFMHQTGGDQIGNTWLHPPVALITPGVQHVR